MSDFLNKSSVLVLNALYQPIGMTTPKKALVALNSQPNHEDCAAKSIDISYGRKADGSFDFSDVVAFKACSFEEWLSVPIREGIDNMIHGVRIVIRSPTVIITNYSKMPLKHFRPTRTLLYDMQQGRCGYSGEKISAKAASIEHKTPKSKGGRDTFENLMVVKKEINHKRGNKPLEELGLKPLFHHKEPRPLPMSYSIKKIEHPDWKYFLEVK